MPSRSESTLSSSMLMIPGTFSARDRKSTRLNSSHTKIYTLSLHDALPICTSRNNNRPCGVADAFQVRKHTVEFHVDDSRHVLSKNPSWSCLRNNSEHFRPDVTVIFLAPSLPGTTERLARK